MTRDDLRILCTALGFTLTNLKDLPLEQQAIRAKTYARIIESGCFITEPSALGATNENLGDESDPASVDKVIDRYKAELLAEESAELPDDRQSLLKLFDRLMVRKMRREQRDFYVAALDDVIADQILKMVEVEIEHDGEEG